MTSPIKLKKKTYFNTRNHKALGKHEHKILTLIASVCVFKKRHMRAYYHIILIKKNEIESESGKREFN